MNCKYLNYYYSPNEIQEYIGQWTVNITNPFTPYTENEYKMYEELTIENAHLDYVQINHYMDEGCLCKACFIKRQQMATQLIHGQPVTDRVVHIEAKNELLTRRVEKVNRINTFNASIRPMPKGGRKDFRNEMTNVVRCKK
jgi:CO dehydrogenase nickel-insertion accessory protein CooC1